MKRGNLTGLKEAISEGLEEVEENVGTWRKEEWRPLLNIIQEI